MTIRITLYKDPLNEKNWIVARDKGDPSEEVVLAERANYKAAKIFAAKKAREMGATLTEEHCTLR